MKNSVLRFLITPNFAAPYDKRMVSGLAEGLNAIGHQTIALPAPVSSREVALQCEQYSIDILIQINRTRSPDVELPGKVRYISWFQDVFPETLNNFAECFHESDILYALGDPSVLGLNARMPCFVGSLVTGVDPEIFNLKKTDTCESIDFSLCGFIPPPLSRKRSVLQYLITRNIKYYTSEIIIKTVEETYTPLCGALNIHELELSIRNNINNHHEQRRKNKPELLKSLSNFRRSINFRHKSDPRLQRQFEKSLNYFTREYPRLLDRVALIDKALSISEVLELYGPGWDKHKKYKKYAKGVISTQSGLSEIYRKSRINLANNTHGLGLHSRTLECMAVGGFIFTHESPHDMKPGGMLTSFEPGTHFGNFKPDNFREEALRWLNDNKRRLEAGIRASEIIKQRHLWRHRARQIINDLME